ncbi:MAG: hypothetical protein N2C12_07710, partial [Planctomycetales bacterium]
MGLRSLPLAMMLLFAATAARAQTHEYAAVSSVSAMERRIGELENRLASYDSQSFSSPGCDAIALGDACCEDDGCGCAGFTFGGEIAFLQFGNSGGLAGS